MDEGMARSTLARANHARTILEDQIVIETFERMETRLRQAWEGSKFHDSEGREEAYRMLRTLKLFKDEFGQMLSDGEVARGDLARLKAFIKGVVNG